MGNVTEMERRFIWSNLEVGVIWKFQSETGEVRRRESLRFSGSGLRALTDHPFCGFVGGTLRSREVVGPKLLLRISRKF